MNKKEHRSETEHPDRGAHGKHSSDRDHATHDHDNSHELLLERSDQFSRHIRLPYFGAEGQKKINRAKVFVVGAGGLGSPAATYLAAAGIGTLGLTDNDAVEISNLPRQILHSPETIDELKITSAEKRLSQLNPDLKLNLSSERLKAKNVIGLIKGYDVVIDGSDNFATKFLLNDACVMHDIPLIHAGVLRYGGQAMTILPGKSACYRCIFPEPPPANSVPTCQEAGILNTVAGIIGLIQATEAIKLIIGAGQLLTNKLLVFDGLEMSFRAIAIQRNKNCPVCSKNAKIKKLTDCDSASLECR
ncbi:MAG TPA: ThiF family adenylyltransferase [Planctomycetota bacterium]|nr:ThiF family adenylyltransferase [Planctomycetota bacterium]